METPILFVTMQTLFPSLVPNLKTLLKAKAMAIAFSGRFGAEYFNCQLSHRISGGYFDCFFNRF